MTSGLIRVFSLRIRTHIPNRISRTNSYCNDRLKTISEQIDCLKEKKVTSHLARHRFVTLFLSERSVGEFERNVRT